MTANNQEYTKSRRQGRQEGNQHHHGTKGEGYATLPSDQASHAARSRGVPDDGEQPRIHQVKTARTTRRQPTPPRNERR
ncbi:unnamed protein product, partial [Ectocarpus sp. 12 AP-2014]